MYRLAVKPDPVTDGSAGQLTILFDRDCGVCRETVRTLRRWDRDRRLEFLPLQEVEASGRPTLQGLAVSAALADQLHVVDEATGLVSTGGQAALTILDALPGGWLFRPWAGLPSTEVAANLLYRLVARHRDTVAWLIGLPDELACPVPGTQLPDGDAAPLSSIGR